MSRLYCVRECTRRDHHLAACEDRDECRGCEPRQAEHGNLCWPCHRRLELMLTDLPTVVDWLRVHLNRGIAQRLRTEAEMIHAKHSEAPAPIDLDVLDHIDVMFACVLGWADNLVTDVKANGSDLLSPEPTVKDAAPWLLRHLRTLELQEWVGEAWEELAETMSIAHGLAPWRPEVRKVPGVPCPECSAVALVIYGGETDVTCQRCRMMIPEDRYGIWARMHEEGVAS
jgi:hypothetical protein